MLRVGVLGAGAVGLSTALCIKLQYPSVPVAIIADRFLETTTSDGAGALFRPDEKLTPGVDPSVFKYD